MPCPPSLGGKEETARKRPRRWFGSSASVSRLNDGARDEAKGDGAQGDESNGGCVCFKDDDDDDDDANDDDDDANDDDDDDDDANDGRIAPRSIGRFVGRGEDADRRGCETTERLTR